MRQPLKSYIIVFMTYYSSHFCDHVRINSSLFRKLEISATINTQIPALDLGYVDGKSHIVTMPLRLTLITRPCGLCSRGRHFLRLFVIIRLIEVYYLRTVRNWLRVSWGNWKKILYVLPPVLHRCRRLLIRANCQLTNSTFTGSV